MNNSKIMSGSTTMARPHLVPESVSVNHHPNEAHLDTRSSGQEGPAKPKGAAALPSAGARHECGTGLLLPIVACPPMAIGAAFNPTWQQLLCSYYQQQFLFPPVVKDDVFLAPADNQSVNGSSNSSVSSSSSSSYGNWAPTPCLSPVTSPSDFLCDHEPLFDGIEDLQQQQQPQEQKTTTEDTDNSAKSSPEDTTTFNLDWYEYSKEGQPTILPTPSPTASEIGSVFDDDPSAFDFLDDSDSSSSDDDEEGQGQLKPGLKRKRSFSIDSESDDDDEGQEEEEAPMLQRRIHRLRLSDDRKQQPVKKKKKTTTAAAAKAAAVTKRRARRNLGRRTRPRTTAPVPLADDNSTTTTSTTTDSLDDFLDEDGRHITIFERLTQAGIDWCRYCGTTEGVNWRPGPWGKRTLCNKHGCDYKGYGIASRLPRLDLSAFSNEKLEDRRRPVVQQFCAICKKPDALAENNKLIACQGGCSRAYHQLCRVPEITDSAYQDQPWCCSPLCRENRRRNRVAPYDA